MTTQQQQTIMTEEDKTYKCSDCDAWVRPHDSCCGSDEEDVCCVGCNERVCSFNEEPPHKDSRDEAVCNECAKFIEVELKDYNGVMLPKYINGREVLCYPNAGLPIYRDKTYEEFKKEIEPLEKFSNESYDSTVHTLDKDIKVGDVISISTGYRYQDLYEVSRITKCFIVFKACKVVKSNIQSTTGDTVTYCKYLDIDNNGYEKKKKIKYYDDSAKWNGHVIGYRVFNKQKTIMIKSGESDIWR